MQSNESLGVLGLIFLSSRAGRRPVIGWKHLGGPWPLSDFYRELSSGCITDWKGIQPESSGWGKIERYLCLYKGNEIMEKFSTSSYRGGLGLINVKERIQAIQALEYLQANQQHPETDNVSFEVRLHQKTLYRTVVVKGANTPQTKEVINLLLKDINKINQYTATHKTVKPKNIQDILFPKN